MSVHERYFARDVDAADGSGRCLHKGSGHQHWGACLRLYPEFPSNQARTIFLGCDPKYVRRTIFGFDCALVAESIVSRSNDDR